MNGENIIKTREVPSRLDSSHIGKNIFSTWQKVCLILTACSGVLNPAFAEEGHKGKDKSPEIRLQHSTTLGKGGPVQSTSAMALFSDAFGPGQHAGGLVGHQWGAKWETTQAMLGVQPTEWFALTLGASQTQGTERQLIKIEPPESESSGEEGKASPQPIYLMKDTPCGGGAFSVGGIVFPHGLGLVEDIGFGIFGSWGRGTHIDSVESLANPHIQTFTRDVGLYASALLDMEKIEFPGLFLKPGITWELEKEWARGEEPGRKWLTFTPSLQAYYTIPEIPNTLFTGEIKVKIPTNGKRARLGFGGGAYHTIKDTQIVVGAKVGCLQGEESSRFSCQATLGINLSMSGENSVFSPEGRGLHLFHFTETPGLGE